MTADNSKGVHAALNRFCALEDASDLVTGLRLIKRPTEITFMRRTGTLVDAALDEAKRLAVADVDEDGFLAGIQGAVFCDGADYASNEFIIGSGRHALLSRFFTDLRVLDKRHQMTLEFAGAYRHYHACLMRKIVICEAIDFQRDEHDTNLETPKASCDALRPVRPIGELFDAHAKVIDRRGDNHARTNACGYSLSAVFASTKMDTPILYNANFLISALCMVFLLHMIMMGSKMGLAMALGETVLMTESGNARLSAASLDLEVD